MKSNPGSGVGRTIYLQTVVELQHGIGKVCGEDPVSLLLAHPGINVKISANNGEICRWAGDQVSYFFGLKDKLIPVIAMLRIRIDSNADTDQSAAFYLSMDPGPSFTSMWTRIRGRICSKKNWILTWKYT